MKQYASSGQSRILVADISLMNRREIKNRITGKIWAAVRRVEKYKIGAAVQILETLRFILFRDDSFRSGPVNYATIHLREVCHQYSWLVTGVFFHIFGLK